MEGTLRVLDSQGSRASRTSSFKVEWTEHDTLFAHNLEWPKIQLEKYIISIYLGNHLHLYSLRSLKCGPHATPLNRLVDFSSGCHLPINRTAPLPTPRWESADPAACASSARLISTVELERSPSPSTMNYLSKELQH